MVTEEQYLEGICKAAHVDDIGDVSDGYHTFNQLYYQRMMLFATIVKQNRDKAWKSLRHEDGELCFGGGWFIVGIDTPEGSYTYHYEDKYFDLFDCEVLDHGKHWDGHTEKDVTRLLSLNQEGEFFQPCQDCNTKMNEIRRAYDKLKASSELTNGEIIEELENTIELIKQDGKDWLDDRDIPILEACIKSLTALDKIRDDIEEYKSRQLAIGIGIADLEQGKQIALEYVLAILDQYKSESEDKE